MLAAGLALCKLQRQLLVSGTPHSAPPTTRASAPHTSLTMPLQPAAPQASLPLTRARASPWTGWPQLHNNPEPCAALCALVEVIPILSPPPPPPQPASAAASAAAAA